MTLLTLRSKSGKLGQGPTEWVNSMVEVAENDFARWETISYGGFPQWRIILRGGISSLPSLQAPIHKGGSLQPSPRRRGGMDGCMEVRQGGNTSVEKVSHRGRWFPTVGNHLLFFHLFTLTLAV